MTIGVRPSWQIECVLLQRHIEIDSLELPFPNYRVGIPVALSATSSKWVQSQRCGEFIQLIRRSVHVAVFCSADELVEVLTRQIQFRLCGAMDAVITVGKHGVGLGMNGSQGFVQCIRFTCVKSINQIFQTLAPGFRFVEVDPMHALCPVGEKEKLFRWINKQ